MMVQYDKMSEEEEAQYSQQDYSISEPLVSKEELQSVPQKKKSFYEFAKERTVKSVGGVIAYGKKVKAGMDASAKAKKEAFDALPETEKTRITEGRKKAVSSALSFVGLNEESEQPRSQQAPRRNPFDSMFGGGSGSDGGGGYSMASPPAYQFGMQPSTQSKGSKKRVAKPAFAGIMKNPLDAMFSTPNPTRGIKPPKRGVGVAGGNNFFANFGMESKKKVRTVKGKKVKSTTFRL